jgi:hypothetical protein
LSASIDDAVSRIRAWGESRDWCGYDPYDGLNSPAAAILSGGTAIGRRLLTQAVKLSPINVRPLLTIRPARNAKAIALVASGYARVYAATEDKSAREQSERWSEWLVGKHSGGESGLAWGYHFDVQTRVFKYPRGTPNTIATTFAAHSLLDGVELLGEERWGSPAREAARYLTSGMLTRSGSIYFRYLPGEDELVHNANMLACSVLARSARVLDDSSLFEPAAEALATTVAAQHPDGSWPYAAQQGHAWVDNFHTGYVLESLAHCMPLAPEVREPLERGVAFWESRFFLSDGTPKYFPERALPLDAHCYAQAIETWLAVADWHPPALARAERTARLLIDRMLDPSGYVHFQQRRFWKNKVPFIRWSTAPSFRALAGLLLQLQGEKDRPRQLGTAHADLA